MKVLAAILMALGVMGSANAALIDRGNGMIYDTTRDITWLADMNQSFTSGYAAANEGGTGSNQIFGNGRMGWNAAVAWASQLVYGGFSGWRLPTLNPADTTCVPSPVFPQEPYSYACTGGELSGLFVKDLGNKANDSVLNQEGDTPEQIANMTLFSNVEFGDYWSGTEYATIPHYAWSFATYRGDQNGYDKELRFFAVAVRDGDVANVPVPATLALLGLGLVGIARQRSSRSNGKGQAQ
jgi:hypothetical protein